MSGLKVEGIPWKLKRKQKNIINNSMSTNLITQMKYTNALKDTVTKTQTR